MSGKAKILGDILKVISGGGPGSSKGYVKWMPNKVRVVSVGEGSCVCEMTVDEDSVNVNNHMHGGCTATLVEMICALPTLVSQKPRMGVSSELSVSYMSAAKLGEDIVIDAKTIKSGKNLAFMQVEISRKSDGATIAVGKQTQFLGQGVVKSMEVEEILKNNMNSG